ncbi:tol-pal system protein YbgF [Solidesulfovibrio sp.]|uniref:tol-pal system protein YbgF n=1 Tax=Solidesulfovibrio sp. TaxID=2910990 RepID=UPI00262BE833|nr:tol-pal system protein YbgF [Solidesulfovibrio sp.]
MKTRSRNTAVLAAALAAVLGGCAPAPKTPAPLNTPADMWAELENTKGEVRRLNAKVEELSQQVQANKNDPELAGRVARLEGNVNRMASQLAIDLGGQGAAPAAAAPSAAAPQAGYGQAQAGYGQPQTGYAQPQAGGYGQQQQAGYGQAQGGYAQQQTGYGAQGGYGSQAAPGGAGPDDETEIPPYNATGYAAPTAQAPAQPQPAAQPAAAPQNPADAVYAKGLASFNAKQYQEALGIFQEFSRNFKTSPLMPNALFWMGECYFQLGDFANAALSYQEVIEKYPKSAKHADSLFKRGVAFSKLGNAGAAKLSFKEVIDKYPDSAFAARAKTMMPK